MSAADRTRWDTIYRDRSGHLFPSPDPILFQYVPLIEDAAEHRALDLAGGIGQNALWLAAQGYVTDLVDISRVALMHAQAEMAIRNLRSMNFIQMDVDRISLDEAIYDVACVFRYLKRPIFPVLGRSVRPGGRIIYETFNRRYLEIMPQFNPAFLLEIDELVSFFPGWEVLHIEESTHVSQLVVRKPQPSDLQF